MFLKFLFSNAWWKFFYELHSVDVVLRYILGRTYKCRLFGTFSAWWTQCKQYIRSKSELIFMMLCRNWFNSVNLILSNFRIICSVHYFNTTTFMLIHNTYLKKFFNLSWNDFSVLDVLAAMLWRILIFVLQLFNSLGSSCFDKVMLQPISIIQFYLTRFVACCYISCSNSSL